MPRTAQAALTLALLVITASGAPAAHPHYERLLREGIYALEQGEHSAAVRDLRLACFGLLEEPESLARCLGYLGLAQAGAGDTEGFRETFRRLVDLEERFGAYSAADLPADARSSLEVAALESVPPSTLLRSPGFDHLLEAPEETQAATEGEPEAGDQGEREEPPGAEAGARRAAGEPGQAETGSPETGSSEPAGDTPADPAEERTERSEESARADRVLAPEDRERLDRARELLDGARSRAELDEPFLLATAVADRNPRSREAQHLTAVIAYRASQWEDAVRYFRRGGDPGDEQPHLLFYLAVSLYESGRTEAAAETLRRSLPHLEQTPFVRTYRQRILGDRADDPAGGAS